MPRPREIEAAGGLVRRQGPAGLEVVLVHRPLRDDWTLPIGRLEPGEELAACALREVREETGLECRIVGFLETLTVDGEDEGVVHHFHLFEMEPLGGAFVPNPETDQAVWSGIDEAISRATYPNVRSLLSSFSPRD